MGSVRSVAAAARYRITAPPEVVRVLMQHGVAQSRVEAIPWFAIPQLPLPSPPKSGKIQMVNAQELLEPYLQLGDKRLTQTLRTMDGLNGCLTQCDTCCADSLVPSAMFDLHPLEQLFLDERFLAMLQPDSLRIGSSGDILNHPEGIEFIKMLLRTTARLGIKIKVLTTYLPKNESALDELLALAVAHPERLKVIISIALNRTDTIRNQFFSFLQQRAKMFLPSAHLSCSERPYGLKEKPTQLLSNVSYSDISYWHELKGAIKAGRIMSEELNERRLPGSGYKLRDLQFFMQQRGQVKLYLNPSALWLQVYVTNYDSHTGKIYTPLPVEPLLLEAFLNLPFHGDFPRPPHWPGGQGKLNTGRDAYRIIEQLEDSGTDIKPLHIVG